MRKKGKLRSWNDQKGFGFVDPGDGSKEIFLHISAFSNRSRRPEIGQYVTYTLSADKQSRPRASDDTLPGDRVKVKDKKSGGAGAVIAAGLFYYISVSQGIFLPFLTIPAWLACGSLYLFFSRYLQRNVL